MLKKIRSVAIYIVCSSSLTALATDALAIETGLASYYSNKFQGRKTASGARYDKNKLTAAHRSLPIGSQIAVTNLRNHNSVIVTINDRGPYNSHRKLDLSYAAAKELGLVAMGVAPVSYELVSPNHKNTDFKDNFEQVIPHEYTPGVLEVAKSEEELIEAEEEVVNPETQTPAVATLTDVSEEEKSDTPPHPHKAKKSTASVKETQSSKSHKHSAAHPEKESKTKKSSQSHQSKTKHHKTKATTQSKKSAHKKAK